MYYCTEFKLKVLPSHVASFSFDTQGKVTLVAKLLLSPVAQKAFRHEQDIFIRFTCVHSRTLLSNESS
jgi:hypothetical protein